MGTDITGGGHAFTVGGGGFFNLRKQTAAAVDMYYRCAERIMRIIYLVPVPPGEPVQASDSTGGLVVTARYYSDQDLMDFNIFFCINEMYRFF